MRIRVFLTGIAVIGLASACGDDDPTGPPQQIYQATLSGANERPAPVTTSGTGFFNGVISDGNFLNYTITWSGLSSASNNGHFHGPQTTGATAAAGVALDLNAPTEGRTITHSSASGGAGSAQGQIDLRTTVALANGTTISGDSLKKLLDTGGLYINIHTVNNPGGEILGVITKQ